ncbi:MAG: NAD(P)H-hydrate epimerase, partial [Candidatus Dadabacteria bacterium]
MERAGKAIASELLKHYNFNQKSVLVFCGPGNNGGDGLVISRILKEKKINTTTVIAGAKKYSEDFLKNLEKLKLVSDKIYLYKPVASLKSVNPITEEELENIIAHSNVELIVDSLLGTGQKSPPKGAIKEIIEIINRSLPNNTQITAVDMPTGFNTDSGEVYTPHLRANLTVCIELIKKGMFQYPARDICGKIVTVSIGINCSKGTSAFILDQKTAPYLPKRAPWAHKGDFGPSLIIAGSRNMPGASALAAKAALKAGCSLVTCAYPEKVPALEQLLIPEVIRAPLPDNNKGYFTEDSLPFLKNKLANFKSVAVGCGIGSEK